MISVCIKSRCIILNLLHLKVQQAFVFSANTSDHEEPRFFKDSEDAATAVWIIANIRNNNTIIVQMREGGAVTYRRFI